MAVVIITSTVIFMASLWEGHFTWVNSSLTERKNSSGRDIELFYHACIVLGIGCRGWSRFVLVLRDMGYNWGVL